MTQIKENDSICVVLPNGDKEWRNKDDELHRLDGPAIEFANGGKQWYQNGKLHRNDGPAVEYANGDKWWYQNGKLHRLDGPAVEWKSGNKYWYQNGKLIKAEQGEK